MRQDSITQVILRSFYHGHVHSTFRHTLCLHGYLLNAYVYALSYKSIHACVGGAAALASASGTARAVERSLTDNSQQLSLAGILTLLAVMSHTWQSRNLFGCVLQA